jgi:hypothetical protein
MIRLRIINDIHLFGVNPHMTADEMLTAIHSSPYPVFLNGDIVDMANAKYKDLPNALILLTLLAKQFNFILGNHDLNMASAPNFRLIDNGLSKILIIHSDVEQWGIEKSAKFRSQTPGAGWFKRNVISKTIDSLRHLLAVRPNDRLIAAIRKWKQDYPEITTVICSHSHPPDSVFFKVDDDIYSVITMRGVNDMEIRLDGSIYQIGHS